MILKRLFFFIFLILTLVFKLQGDVITPSNDKMPLNDPYSAYQWGLFPHGQVISENLTDIILKPKTVEPYAGIGWRIGEKLPQMKKDVIVAVIDSGVDVEHEDLKGLIALNTKECSEENKAPSWDMDSLPEDKDGNGYQGDCWGWNFTENNNIVKDRKGHGTHVAGIVSAVTNNNIGISGLSNRIKILPIKVFRALEENQYYKILKTQGKKNLEEEELGEKGIQNKSPISKAIDYAILRKADVIQMSFGYPLVFDVPDIRASIQKALEKNITVVVASGNNGHNAFILPCAISSVLCVGASNGLGELSRFSNYGGHVDLLAPGVQIFSLFSKDVNRRQFFNYFASQNYGIFNGTSQASPFVSSSVAFLKGVFPSISNDEIKARLYLSAKSSHNKKKDYTIQGLFNLSKALFTKPQAVLRPNFKVQRLTELIENKAEIHFQVKNYWKETKNLVQVKVHLKDPFEMSWEFDFKGFSQGKIEDIKFQIPIENENLHSQLRFFVEIHEGSRSIGSFFHEVDIYKSFKTFQDKSFVKVNLPYRDEEDEDFSEFLSYLFEKKGALKRVYEPYKASPFPTYYTTYNTKEGLKVFIWSFKTPTKLEKKEIFIPNLVDDRISFAPQFIKADFNFDGKKDYLIKGATKDSRKEGGEKNKQYIQYSFFDHNLNPLFKGISSHWRRKFDNISLFANPNRDFIVNLYNSEMRFFPIESDDPRIGIFNSPLILTSMKSPKFDTLLHPDDSHLNYIKNSLFYLNPVIRNDKKGNEVVFLEERIMNSYKFKENLRNKIEKYQEKEKDEYFDVTNPFTAIEFLTLFPQKTNTELKALLAVGKGQNKIYYGVSFKENIENYTLEKLDYKNYELQGNKIEPLISISQNKVQPSEGLVFVKSFNLKRILREPRVLITDPEDITKYYPPFYPSFEKEDEKLNDFLKSYKTETKLVSFYVTSKSNIAIQSISLNTKKEKMISKKIIYSDFFPGMKISENYQTTLILDKKKLRPAVYIDASLIYAKKVYFLVFDEEQNKIIQPIKYSLKIPENCFSLGVTSYGKEDDFKANFFCKEEKEWNLYFATFD